MAFHVYLPDVTDADHETTKILTIEGLSRLRGNEEAVWSADI
jgi:hypothetical protein